MPALPDRRLNVFTWHVHGSYLYYLSHCPHDFYLPVKPGRPEGYGGRAGNFPWPENVHDVPAEQVKNLSFDCILFQSQKNYLEDQFEILSEGQRSLPRIYLEHDPPREHPTDTRHILDDPEILLVHVTHFNNLMWDSGRTPTCVIEHGVVVPEGVRYTGEIDKGIVVVNGLPTRGRRLGLDIFETVRDRVPIDLVGMQSERMGGLGEISPSGLAEFESRYRFFFNPIRYTSLGLAVCEAMMVGLPVIGLATTEMVSVIENGKSGYLSTDPESLIECMEELIASKDLAQKLSVGARQIAMQRFNIRRFANNWNEAFFRVGNKKWLKGRVDG